MQKPIIVLIFLLILPIVESTTERNSGNAVMNTTVSTPVSIPIPEKKGGGESPPAGISINIQILSVGDFNVYLNEYCCDSEVNDIIIYKYLINTTTLDTLKINLTEQIIRNDVNKIIYQNSTITYVSLFFEGNRSFPTPESVGNYTLMVNITHEGLSDSDSVPIYIYSRPPVLRDILPSLFDRVKPLFFMGAEKGEEVVTEFSLPLFSIFSIMIIIVLFLYRRRKKQEWKQGTKTFK